MFVWRLIDGYLRGCVLPEDLTRPYNSRPDNVNG